VSYELLIRRRAQKQLAKVASESFDRICDRIRELSQDPRPKGSRKLAGRDGWRIRVGSYRVVYDIDDSKRIVEILDVGHRRDVYR
jgi:mRNA interferase RelE/StbE